MPDIDLNLLRVFDMLFELRSVTRAADRLGLTQSAISHALGRLRDRLDDRLFVRGPEGLQPTARALEIAPGIREGLLRLRGALAPSIFDPATAERRFTIAAGTYFCALLVPALIERSRRLAPGISFHIFPIGEDMVSAMDQGLIDVALGAFRKVPSRFETEPLYREDRVWIAAADHPLARGGVDVAALARQPRIGISAARAADGRGAVITDGGIERQVIADTDAGEASGPEIVTVYDAQTAITLVARTDVVALVPRRAALAEAGKGRIAILGESAVPSGIELSMLWHGKQQEDVGLAWLRAMLRAAAE